VVGAVARSFSTSGGAAVDEVVITGAVAQLAEIKQDIVLFNADLAEANTTLRQTRP